MSMTWSPERETILRNRTALHHTAKAIADELGVTRNAVLGKMFRLKISNGNGPGMKDPNAPPKRPHRKRRPKRMTALDFLTCDDFTPRQAEVEPLNISIKDLNHKTCRFPYGDDPRTVTYCGHLPYGELPYCAAHCRITYTAPARRPVKAWWKAT
jgi:GcrA cell cycle regulator